ncbi:amidohydrolase family protein [Nocardia sp. NPDC046473]|uniref:amidohydrolase family protein n=1 Tax=Nocardia sp. NPDC046473 TaxID=3155733 RepID=UPI0034115310
MESPDWLIRYADPEIRARLRPLDLHGHEGHVDGPAETGAESTPQAVMAEKNWRAKGASDADGRAHALDLLGFRSQLVFSTYSHLGLIDIDGVASDPDVLYGTVRAHNRGMIDFCQDPRLLPVGWVAPDVPERAAEACAEALEMGCAAIEMPTYPVGPRSLTHPDLHPVYQMLEQAECPLVFHVGSGGPLVPRVYANNGLTDADGNPGHLTTLAELTFIGLSVPVERVLAALIFDGVFERFPGLRCGVIEHGAMWVPGFLRRLDLAPSFAPLSHGQRLSMSPSDYFRRHVKVTPFPFEDVGTLIAECGAEIFMFGSDYPHDEGGLDPLGQFELTLAERSEAERDRFYRSNFEALMHAHEFAPVMRDPQAARSVLARTGETEAVLRKKALFRLLARQAADGAEITVADGDITGELHMLMQQHRLESLDEVSAWMKHEHITDDTLRRFLADGVLIGQLGKLHRGPLDDETTAQIQISTIRTWRERS